MTWALEFEHVGGIVSGEARIEPGLNVIRASNWQGKSSFLQSLQTALGVATPLTEGAAEGFVRYDAPDRSGTVELERSNGSVERRGDPVLTDTYDVARAELFACLGEENPVRRAVRTGSDLEDLMLRPLDFENIEERISERRHEREQIDAEIARAREAKKRLPSLQERVTDLEATLSDLRDRRDRLRDAEAGDSARRSDLTEAESELAQVESRVEQLSASVERTRANLAEAEADLEAVEVPDDAEVDDELDAVEERLRDLRRDKSVLESVHAATQTVLTEDRLDLLTDVDRELTGDSVACWTCGEATSRDALESRLAALRDRLESVQDRVDAAQAEREELEAKREQVVQSRRERERLESEVADLREKLSADEESLERARERRAELSERVERLSDAVSEDVAELTDVESDIKYREAELGDVRDDVEKMEARAERLDALEAQRERVQSDLEALRDRKASIREATREEFDAAMQDVVDRFETGFETARLTPSFELVVARDGRRASLDALSEGELELLGFVAALAGYEAFDVHEVSPMLLVDRVGGLDERNLHALVAYLRERTEYLVFTAYPAYESAEATVVDPSEWTVRSEG